MADPAPKVTPLDIRRTAAAVAANYGDRGAIIITVGDDGVRIGTEGLTAEELREALCIAINCSYEFDAAD
jgi:hypothetical protein